MNEEQRIKLAALKKANAKYAKNLQWRNNALLQECLNVIGAYRIIDGATEAGEIMAIANGAQVTQARHNAGSMIDPDLLFYVVWDEAQLPIIECSGNEILAHWEDVLAVSFDTCLVNLAQKRAILIRK